MITTLFPRGFVFAPVQYHFPPEIMTNQVSDLPNLINPELRESYPDELILCNQHVNEVCTSLTNYLMCDHSWMETCFKDKNFEKYFPECKFLEFSELKNSNLFGLKQLLMSISSYNNFRDKNKEKLDTGEIEDPLEVMSRNFLNSLSKEQSFEITQTDEVLRSVGLQFLWRYFVHILSNWYLTQDFNVFYVYNLVAWHNKFNNIDSLFSNYLFPKIRKSVRLKTSSVRGLREA